MEKFDMSIDTYTLGIAWFYIGLFLLFVLAGMWKSGTEYARAR